MDSKLPQFISMTEYSTRLSFGTPVVGNQDSVVFARIEHDFHVIPLVISRDPAWEQYFFNRSQPFFVIWHIRKRISANIGIGLCGPCGIRPRCFSLSRLCHFNIDNPILMPFFEDGHTFLPAIGINAIGIDVKK